LVYGWCSQLVTTSHPRFNRSAQTDMEFDSDSDGEALSSRLPTAVERVLRDVPVDCNDRFALTLLPDMFHTLFHRVNKEACALCDDASSALCICLLCGVVVCNESRDCVRRHVNDCDGYDGVFLSLKRCEVLLVHGGLSCYFPSIYLDEHGEEDVNLQRGRPLHLNPQRYQQLLHLYLRGGIGDYVQKNSRPRLSRFTIRFVP